MSKEVIDPATGVTVSVSDEQAETLGWPAASSGQGGTRKKAAASS